MSKKSQQLTKHLADLQYETPGVQQSQQLKKVVESVRDQLVEELNNENKRK